MGRENQREELVKNLETQGYIKSGNVKQSMLKVSRELFIEHKYFKDAYSDFPLPIPGEQTISAPHMHALTLSELGIQKGDNILEIGAGSGILLAYMRELVGSKGKITGMEIVKETFEFAKGNLQEAGYNDVTLIHGDGSGGYSKNAPYDRIIVSASAPKIPKVLIEQLKFNGILLIVIGSPYEGQSLVKVKKTATGKVIKKEILPVIFVPLRGKYGWKRRHAKETNY